MPFPSTVLAVVGVVHGVEVVCAGVAPVAEVLGARFIARDEPGVADTLVSTWNVVAEPCEALHLPRL